jgi:alpha-mannosidase
MTTPAPNSEEIPPGAGEQSSEVDPTPLEAMPLATSELGGTSEPDRSESTSTVADQALSAPAGWVLIALVPFEGREPPRQASDDLAQAVWCAVSSLWHPALLSSAVELPRIESIESPSPPGEREIRVLAGGLWDQLPSGYRTQAEDSRTVLLESGTDRARLITELRARLPAGNAADLVESEEMTNAAHDFLAFGTVRWMLRDLTIAMGHADTINYESLKRDLLAGAHEWRIGDWSSAVNRLRSAFENLTQARERYYPVDAYLMDLCLIDPAMKEGMLSGPLERPIAVSFLMPAQAIENQALHDPERMAALRQAINDGWADVVGGTYAEAEDLLLPLESILWQFRQAGAVYRLNLDDRSVETYARRRFGLHTRVPQIAKRFGFRYALHMGFDAGKFPIPAETKRLWESPDGGSLESLIRPPIAADRPVQGWLLPWRIAGTMRNDHIGAIPLVHWPEPVAPWFLDLRRTGSYSPVLGRWTTLNDFFHLTDRPYESLRPEPDLYQTPYLAQAVAKRDPSPIGRVARHHKLRARYDAISSIQALAHAIALPSAGGATDSGLTTEEPSFKEVESLIEIARHDEAATALTALEARWPETLARGILASKRVKTANEPKDHRPGYLVFNPSSVPRRAVVILPDAAADLRPEGPLRVAQLTDEGVCGLVDLPSFGFAWVPKAPNMDQSPAATGSLVARGRQIRNESLEIEIDAAAGGIRSVAALGESTARLGQQLVMTGLLDAQGKPTVSKMRAERFELDYGGPALVQATSSGSLIDPQKNTRLASFTERFRLWAGRPVLDIDIVVSDLDTAWLERAADADPWSVYLACRWAWPDPSSMLRRGVFWSPEITDVERPETPEYFDISTRSQRTAILFGGLPYHRKHGSRMLDTLLIAGRESTRSFSLGVVLDVENPAHAALERMTPAPVIPVEDGPPLIGPTGWLAQADSKNVVISRLEFVEKTETERSWGLAFHLLETAGHATRCRLRLFRNPSRARQVDFQGDTIIDLTVQEDAVLIDFTPYELVRIEVTLG